jgi:Domain of unknown function (DU1801)
MGELVACGRARAARVMRLFDHDSVMKRFDNPAVAEAFDAFPPRVRRKLLALRELIFATAAATQGAGKLEETLKWGEPAYVTAESKSGSTVRIGWKKAKPDQYAIYFHCQTNLVERFRMLFAADFKFEGNRAIVFNENDALLRDALTCCIAAAMTYHLKKSGK